MNEKKRVLSIDLETYSDVDLGSCGVYRYVEGDFYILLFAYAFDDEDVRVVDMACGEQLPREVRDAIFDPKDLFVLLAKNRLVADWQKRNQLHSRKFHAYFIVFQKCDTKIKYTEV